MPAYTKDQVVSASTDFFNGDKLAADTFTNKYAMTDKVGNYLESTPQDMWKRLAKAIAGAEQDDRDEWEQRFYKILAGFKFVPAGRILFGLGNVHHKATLSNCYVLRINSDSMDAVFQTAKEAAVTYAYGGGVGIDIGPLRPRGSIVNNSAKRATGAVSFMDLFSMITGLVGQNCLAAGTSIMTQSGWMPIENVAIGEKVWTHLGWKRVLRHFKNGKRRCVKLVTKRGLELVATRDHKVAIAVSADDGIIMKPIGKLSRGDSIISLCNYSGSNRPAPLGYERPTPYESSDPSFREIRIPESIDNNLAYLIGYSYGDGSVRHQKNGEPYGIQLATSNKWPSIRKKLINILRSHFPDLRVSTRKGDGDCKIVQFYSRRVMEWLRDLGCLKQKALDITFPALFKTSDSELAQAFIAGYFDADGYSSGSKKGYAIASISCEFLSKLQLLYLEFGIISTLHHCVNNYGIEYLELTVTGKSSERRFLDTIGSYSIKAQLRHFIASSDFVRTAVHIGSIGHSRHPEKWNFVPQKPKEMSRPILEKYAKVRNLPDLLIYTNTIRDEIESIIADKLIDTYDIEVEDAHRFCADGLYVSNSRIGALMLTIPINHPDIEEFIDVKSRGDLDKIRYANISVRLTDEFMQAVKDDTEFKLEFSTPYETIERSVNARELWDKLVASAHKSAEPGCLFWDTIKRESPADQYADLGFETISTNPCSEVGLSDGDSCVLGAISLDKFVLDPFSEKTTIDELNLRETIRLAVRFLDNIVTLDTPPLQKQIEAKRKGRRIGLGIMGLGDMLVKLRIKFDSEEAQDIISKVFNIIRNETYNYSTELAKEKGSFPVFEAERTLRSPFVQRLPNEIKHEIANHGLRNISLLSIAPTGSIAILAQTTSGVEPIFALKYERKVNMGRKKDVKKFTVYHHTVREYKDKFDVNDGQLPDFFVAAHQIDSHYRVKLQGLINRYIDHSISSTVNLPADATIDDIRQIYMQAYESGCKGITVYREGSREGVLTTDNAFRQKADTIIRYDAPKRPKLLPAIAHLAKSNGHTYVVFLGFLGENIYEVFAVNHKLVGIIDEMQGSINKWCDPKGHKFYEFESGPLLIRKINIHEDNEASTMTRLISTALRHGTPLEFVIDQIAKSNGSVASFGKSIARVLALYVNKEESKLKFKCRECKSTNVEWSGFCYVCKDCSMSLCS